MFSLTVINRNRLKRRQYQPRFEAAALAICQRERAAVRLRNVARNTQAQARATGCAIARAFQPVEGLEDAVELSFRNPRSVVEHADRELFIALAHRDRRVLAVLTRVVDQIAETALERERLAGNR